MRRAFIAFAVIASFWLIALPAQAASQVTIQDFSFSPTPLTVPQGTSVSWHNDGPASHTSTSNIGLWNRGPLAAGTTSGAVAFKAAGVFAYHCKIHPSMHGKIRVPIKVSPASGSTGTVFTIRLATARRTGYSFDVQKRAGVGVWKIWKTAVTSLTVTFHQAAAGTWRFRSRLHKNGSPVKSGWSPSKMITIS